MSEPTAPTTDDLLNQAGQEILSWLQSTGDLVAEQAPLLADEIVLRGMILNGTDAAMAAMWFIAGVVSVRYAIFWGKKAQKIVDEGGGQFGRNEETPYAIGSVVSGIGGSLAILVSSVAFLDNIRWVLAIYAAPRVYILEKLASLAGGGG